jgi:hypothetical protein
MMVNEVLDSRDLQICSRIVSIPSHLLTWLNLHQYHVYLILADRLLMLTMVLPFATDKQSLQTKTKSKRQTKHINQQDTHVGVIWSISSAKAFISMLAGACHGRENQKKFALHAETKQKNDRM